MPCMNVRMRNSDLGQNRTAPMSIVVAPGVLRWRVELPASPEKVYAMLTTDAGREMFWAESSHRHDDRIELSFSDGTTECAAIVDERSPHSFAIRYFGALTTFELSPLVDGRTLLEVRAQDVPPGDQVDVAAGWVSVLLCLKARLTTGVDLRNHAPSQSWRNGFVDN